jgi:hypothetical protein
VNYIFAAPNGSSGNPSFRAMVASDVPTLNQSTTGNAATATALASTPTQCTGPNYATGIAANGNANCSTPSGTSYPLINPTSNTDSSLGTSTGSGQGIPGTSLTAGDAYYVGSSGLALAEANTSTTLPAVCIAVSTTLCIYNGVYRFSSSQSWTAGNTIYVSDATAGALVTTAPSTSGHYVQLVGVALASDTILIMPSLNTAGIQ